MIKLEQGPNWKGFWSSVTECWSDNERSWLFTSTLSFIKTFGGARATPCTVGMTPLIEWVWGQSPHQSSRGSQGGLQAPLGWVDIPQLKVRWEWLGYNGTLGLLKMWWWELYKRPNYRTCTIGLVIIQMATLGRSQPKWARKLAIEIAATTET